MSRYTRSGIGFPEWTRAVKTLVIVCGIAFGLEIIDNLSGSPSLILKFGLVPYLVTHHFYVWQLVTYIFLHDTGQIFHILFNMLGLWMFGSDLERLWGSRKFTKYFFICGVGASVLTVLLSPNSAAPTIGASGAVFGLLLAFGMAFPDRIIYFIIFPIPAKWFVVLYGGIEFFSSLSAPGSGIAHVAHLGGMLVGFLYLRGGRLAPAVKWRYEKWRRARLRKKFDVYYNDRHRDNPDDRDDSKRWRN